MGIKHYYNTIKKLGGDATKKAYEKYREVAEAIPQNVRLIYGGNLDSPGIKQLVLKYLKDNCSENEKIVVAVENAENPASKEFGNSLPDNAELLFMPEKRPYTIKESAFLYLLNNYGIKSGALNKLYKREAEALFGVLKCRQIELLSSEKAERIEAILHSGKQTVWNKVPMMFFDRLSAALYRKPSVSKKWRKEFDKTNDFAGGYGLEIWREEQCRGIYAKMKGLSIDSGQDTSVLSGRLTLMTEEVGAEINNKLVLGSMVYDDRFVYDAEIRELSGKVRNEVFRGKYQVRAEFPNREMKAWFSTNVMYISLNIKGEEITVPVLVDKNRRFRKKIYEIKNTGYVCEIKDIYRHYRLVIRESLVTDAKKEKLKLAAAYAAHLLTPWNKPILLYEKKCHGYEESASVLFEKLVDKGENKTRYILDREVKSELDIEEKYKKCIVEQFSFRHYYNLFAARSILSTEAIGHALEKGTNNRLFRNAIIDGHKDYVFLQHGVMYMVSLSAEQRRFFNKRSGHGKQKVVVSSQAEAKHFMDNTDYRAEDLYISGLPKFDKSILNEDADKISVMLTWRPWEEVSGMTDIKQTTYYAMLKDIVRNIPDKLKNKLIVMPHPLVLNQVEEDKDDEVWKYYVPDLKYEEMLKESRVLITDYSSISYDAFYRGSNVIFCWKEKNECIRQYGENARLMLTEDLAFGPVCYENNDIPKAMEDAYSVKQDEKYLEKYGRIVEFHDGENTERLMSMMEHDGIIGELSRPENIYIKKIKRKTAAFINRKKIAEAKAAKKQYPAMLREELNEKGILLEARNGKETDGNIYYILKELLGNLLYEEYEIFISVLDKKVENGLKEKIGEEDFGRVRSVIVDSADYYRAFATCKYIINDATIKNFFVKREGQKYLNVWHGTPFKHMGKKVAHEPHAIGNAQKNFVVADYLLYPSEYMMNHMIEDYMISNISHARVLLSGYPRNSVLLDKEEEKRVRSEIGLEGKRVFVYMPTWRPEMMELSTEEILSQFDAGLGDDEIMLAKIHPLASDKVDYKKYKHIRKFPTEYETYEVLNASDCLITDYSSVFYDYAVTGKKIVLFTYDEEDYLKVRGTYEPIEALPFARTKSIDDTLYEMRTPKQYNDAEFIRNYCRYESINATQKLCRRFIAEDDNTGIEEREIPDNGKDIVFISAGNLAPGARTDRAVAFLKGLDASEKNYFLTFHRSEIKDHWNILFRLPEGISYYGVAGKSDYPEEMEERRKYGNIKIAEKIEIE